MSHIDKEKYLSVLLKTFWVELSVSGKHYETCAYYEYADGCDTLKGYHEVKLAREKKQTNIFIIIGKY